MLILFLSFSFFFSSSTKTTAIVDENVLLFYWFLLALELPTRHARGVRARKTFGRREAGLDFQGNEKKKLKLKKLVREGRQCSPTTRGMTFRGYRVGIEFHVHS